MGNIQNRLDKDHRHVPQIISDISSHCHSLSLSARYTRIKARANNFDPTKTVLYRKLFERAENVSSRFNNAHNSRL